MNLIRTLTRTLACALMAPAHAQLTDSCANAPELAPGMYLFDTFSGTPDGVGTCGASVASPDLWFKFTPPSSGTLTISLCGSQYDSVLGAFDACGGNEIACNDDSCGLQSELLLGVTQNLTIYVRVAGFDGEAGLGTVTIGEVQPGWSEQGDAGDLPSDAQTPTGSGSLLLIAGNLDLDDTDMYAIRICDHANFSATTVGTANADTQLFLFDGNGLGVTFNDDEPSGLSFQSTISATFVSADGDYYLAVSGYDHDPLSADGPMWEDTPFDVERQPDGPGAAGAVSAWTEEGDFGNYAIALTGACFRAGGGCVADVDDGTGTGTPDGGVTIDDLLYYLSLYQLGDVRADVDNGTGTGTQDGGVTIDDLLYYLARFGAGC